MRTPEEEIAYKKWADDLKAGLRPIALQARRMAMAQLYGTDSAEFKRLDALCKKNPIDEQNMDH